MLWELIRHRNGTMGIVAVLATAALYYLCFAPTNTPEAAFIFAVPLLIWGSLLPKKRFFFGYSITALFLGWLGTIYWASAVSTTIFIIVAFYLASLTAFWFLVARWVISYSINQNAFMRLFHITGLSSLWVLLEWLREFIPFGGFPWLPLAASQWERPWLLQILDITGYHGLSFLIIFFNLSITYYLISLFRRCQKPITQLFFVTPEMVIALAAMISVFAYGQSALRTNKTEALLKVGMIQPNSLFGKEQLETDLIRKKIGTISRQTIALETLKPDLIIWPEVAIPAIITGTDCSLQSWLETFCSDINIPIILGGLAQKENDTFNALFLVEPNKGLHATYHIKRKLVPFAEYKPFKDSNSFARNFIYTKYNTLLPGETPTRLELNNKKAKVFLGGLICFETIFPNIVRETTKMGIDALVVVMNTAFQKKGHGTQQYLMHTILRAVENRRIVICCGSYGWSGWIDERGVIQGVLKLENDDIFFEGYGILNVSCDDYWKNKLSFYVQHGNLFSKSCFIFAGLLLINLYFGKRRRLTS